jgi:hypothetical protein
VYGDIEGWVGLPTNEQRQVVRENEDRLAHETSALNTLIAERLSPLTAALEKRSIHVTVPAKPSAFSARPDD